MKSKTSFYSGVVGGGIVIGIFIIILFAVSLFNYRISFNKVFINNTNVSDSISVINKETNLLNHKSLAQQMIQEKLILTPQEYTNNVVNYYNSLLLILSVMLAAFSALSFVYIKSQSKDLIQETLSSSDFQEEVGNKLLGKVENSVQADISSLIERIDELESKLVEFSKNDTNANQEKEIE